ncbi:hypothetical protein NKH14_22610 [Mesorhizobium sp. M1380]|uniref:hypothetical protein n=1 Tax=Mesorhizobium sp. M1380 TaxID=2957093 RepID=UPI00333C091D
MRNPENETAPGLASESGNFESTGNTANLPEAKGSRNSISPQARWKLANPQAVWAQQALRSALKRGLIIQEPCRECGALDAEAHHPDYDKPMCVDWLCRRHHKAVHKKGGVQ